MSILDESVARIRKDKGGETWVYFYKTESSIRRTGRLQITVDGEKLTKDLLIEMLDAAADFQWDDKKVEELMLEFEKTVEGETTKKMEIGHKEEEVILKG